MTKENIETLRWIQEHEAIRGLQWPHCGEIRGAIDRLIEQEELIRSSSKLDKARLDWLEKLDSDSPVWNHIRAYTHIRRAIDDGMKDSEP